MMPNNNLYF